MPGPVGQAAVVAAVRGGELSEAVLDQAVRRVLTLVEKGMAARRPGLVVDYDAQHAIAQRAAEQSIVLLKNTGDLLPLVRSGPWSLAVIGPYARDAHFQGGGSGNGTPTRVVTPLEGLLEELGDDVSVRYARGAGPDGRGDGRQLAEAVEAARSADVALVFVGLPAGVESEGYDRRDLDRPAAFNALVERVAEAQPHTVVILTNGAPVTMPWVDQVPAIVEMGLAGQAHGAAVARILTGAVNPSGRLTETYPVRLQDTPAFISYPGEHDVVRYGEGLFVGYRYYDRRQIAPLFPFGFGLSYTTFAYSALTQSHRAMTDRDTLVVGLTVTNTGDRAGSDVVQAYVRDMASRVTRPNQELKAFAKVHLEPGEERRVELTFTGRDFACYDASEGAWEVEGGAFEILMGSSSRDIRLVATVTVEPAVVRPRKLTVSHTVRDFMEFPEARKLLHGMLPPWVEWDGESLEPEGVMAFVMDTPLAKLERFAAGQVTGAMLEELVRVANRQ
jgi:beta-glucosidase